MDDKLDFGADVSNTANDVDLSVTPATPEEQQEAHRYDGIDDQTKRKQVLYDIKTGKLNPKNFPVLFSVWAKVIDKDPDGRFKFVAPPTKLLKFIQTGSVGDALVSRSMGDIKKMATDIAEEVLRHIPTTNDHPLRKLQALQKNGTLKDIIDFNLRKRHYDLFDQQWYNQVLNPLILNTLSELRKSEKSELRGDLRESLEYARIELRKIFG